MWSCKDDCQVVLRGNKLFWKKKEKTMPSLVNVLSSEVLAGSFFFVKVGKSK